jgi:GT2 family glycosyltransferase
MVRQAIDSVLGQTYRDFELIVVDDGSEDGTAESLAGYGSSVHIHCQPRRGVAAARNRGVAHASGAYLAFLDSDDLWLPRKLEVQIAFMRERPWLQICQTEEIWIRHGARVNPKKKHHKPSGDIFRASLELCLVSPSAVMMKRELFEALGGFDETLPACEDYDLWLRVARSHTVPLISDPLVIKRGGHPDQLSRSTWGLDRFRVAALQKLLDSGLERERRDWALEVLKRKATIVSLGARKRGNQEMARYYDAVVSELS